MWKIVLTGLALFAAGCVKQAEHMAELGRKATLESFLALRCGGEASASVMPGIDAASALHCWGCYAMAAGAAMVVFAGYAKLASPRRQLADPGTGGH